MSIRSLTALKLASVALLALTGAATAAPLAAKLKVVATSPDFAAIAREILRQLLGTFGKRRAVLAGPHESAENEPGDALGMTLCV